MPNADGKTVLDFWQAQEKALEKLAGRNKPGNIAGDSYTVGDAISAYIEVHRLACFAHIGGGGQRVVASHRPASARCSFWCLVATALQ